MIDIAPQICQAIHRSRGCEDTARPEGTCVTCRDVAKIVTAAARPKFAAETFDEAEHILAAAGGAECWVCKRHPAANLTYKNLAVCLPCAGLGLARESMSKLNDTTDAEERAGMAAIDRAGEYLASIGKFDLTTLTDWEMKQFNAHWLNGFSAAMREITSMQPPF